MKTGDRQREQVKGVWGWSSGSGRQLKLRGCGEKGDLTHCSWERQLAQPRSIRIQHVEFQKLKIDLPCDPIIPLLDLIQVHTLTLLLTS